MILDIQCSSLVLNNFLYITKTIMTIIMIAAPILAIISLIILFTKMTMDPDNKKLLNNLKNAVIALVVIFFIPVFVNVTMLLIGNRTNISNCYNNSTRPSSYTKYQETNNNKKEPLVSSNSEEYEVGDPYQLDFSCTSSKIRANFSCNTIKIVERHLDDVNYYNFHSVINSYGGFQNYANSLGGVFKKYYGKQPKVTTTYEFQLIAEYVFGFMYMYGFDYYNGPQDERKYCKWGGGCRNMKEYRETNEPPRGGTSDAFYPGQLMYTQEGLSQKRNFDKMVSGNGTLNMTTNCNWSVDMVFYKAGIFGQGRTGVSSAMNIGQLKKYAKPITKFEDLKPGDIMGFYYHPIDRDKPSTWGVIQHSAFVGEVNKTKGIVTIYDGGSYYMINRNHKWTVKYPTTDKMGYWPGWVGWRIIDLE